MKDKQQITQFIKYVAEDNFSAANKVLKSVVDEKIKNKIRKIDASLAETTNNKKSKTV